MASHGHGIRCATRLWRGVTRHRLVDNKHRGHCTQFDLLRFSLKLSCLKAFSYKGRSPQIRYPRRFFFRADFHLWIQSGMFVKCVYHVYNIFNFRKENEKVVGMFGDRTAYVAPGGR